MKRKFPRCDSKTKAGKRCRRRSIIVRISTNPAKAWCAQHWKATDATLRRVT